MTKRDQLTSAARSFIHALDMAHYTKTDRDRMIAGAALLLRAQMSTGMFGPAVHDDVRCMLNEARWDEISKQ